MLHFYQSNKKWGGAKSISPKCAGLSPMLDLAAAKAEQDPPGFCWESISVCIMQHAAL